MNSREILHSQDGILPTHLLGSGLSQIWVGEFVFTSAEYSNTTHTTMTILNGGSQDVMVGLGLQEIPRREVVNIVQLGLSVSHSRSPVW